MRAKKVSNLQSKTSPPRWHRSRDQFLHSAACVVAAGHANCLYHAQIVLRAILCPRVSKRCGWLTKDVCVEFDKINE
jgi:hypothetical protein